jgi:hypothetical protein
MATSKGNILGMIGFWAFIVGIVLSIIGGIIAPQNAVIILILVILGIIIGFLNITAKEIMLFLVATIALIVAGGVFEPIKVLGIGAILNNVLAYVAALMAPAAVIAAIKALWSVGKPGD